MKSEFHGLDIAKEKFAEKVVKDYSNGDITTVVTIHTMKENEQPPLNIPIFVYTNENKWIIAKCVSELGGDVQFKEETTNYNIYHKKENIYFWTNMFIVTDDMINTFVRKGE